MAFLQESDKSLRTVRSVISYAARLQGKTAAKRRAKPAVPAAVRRLLAKPGGATGPTPLSEVDSKALLRAYGLRTPRERAGRQRGRGGADSPRHRIPGGVEGGPVPSSRTKSDAGGVLLNNGTVGAVRQGYGTIIA